MTSDNVDLAFKTYTVKSDIAIPTLQTTLVAMSSLDPATLALMTREPATFALSTPEPSSWAMMALGFAGLGFAGARRDRKRLSIA